MSENNLRSGSHELSTMEALYREKYGENLKFDSVEKRGSYMVASLKKKEQLQQESDKMPRELGSATYLVVPVKQGEIAGEEVVMKIETQQRPLYTGRGLIDYQAVTSLKIISGQTVSVSIDTCKDMDIDTGYLRTIDATDNAQVSAWLKQEYKEYSYGDYSVYDYRYDRFIRHIKSNPKAKLKESKINIDREKLVKMTLKFAQSFMKNFVCKGDEWTSEKSRLKHGEKVGVNDKWKKQVAKQIRSARDKQNRQFIKELSKQQSIIER